ncbi:MAG: amino acid-binding protein [Eggerthellaceae bacterium]|nr:amino acid-binding protein [Eggerthellaceae bacterium]
MSVKQISAFLQSSPGHLARILALFESANVSVRGYSVSDTGDYGIARFIVDDVPSALNVLEGEGVAHAETDVLCLCLDDAPGELARVMKVLSESGVNISYSYSMISTYIVLKCDDEGKAADALSAAGYEFVSLSKIPSVA